jgi:redox-sensitive bicupin YhaK (pirin superfamily)
MINSPLEKTTKSSKVRYKAMQSMKKEKSFKKLRCIQRSVDRHWVGDGFPVRTLFAYPNLGSVLSPFLLFDYAGPMEFPSTHKRLGVGEHPHRGFETVTIVYEGEVEHRDSSGVGGRIGPGDVQWMTAAGGIVHEEFHGREFARRGGMFEMVQLWVNLPAKDKMSPPRYQPIVNREIPAVRLPNGQGTARIIAGEFLGTKGPARTFTPIHVWDLRLGTSRQINLPVADGHTTALVVLKGSVRVNDSEAIESAEVGLFDRAGESINVESVKDTTALLLSGEPIEEPIVGRGPFVMNTIEEIRQAIADYQSGKMGHLS